MKHELVQEPLPDQGRTFTLKSDEAKKVKVRGNVEVFEVQELTNQIHGAHCHRYRTPGHVYCFCARILVYANPDQTWSDVKQGFILLTTSASLLVRRRHFGRKAPRANSKHEERPKKLFAIPKERIQDIEEGNLGPRANSKHEERPKKLLFKISHHQPFDTSLISFHKCTSIKCSICPLSDSF